MTKRPTPRRRVAGARTGRITASKPVVPFVVYIRFPSSSKEYCYLCKDPSITVDSKVIANGTTVTVHRIAAFDSIATKYVQTQGEHLKAERKKAIIEALTELEREYLRSERLKKLARAVPAARALIKELESL